jgi:hypothetical protein
MVRAVLSYGFADRITVAPQFLSIRGHAKEK